MNIESYFDKQVEQGATEMFLYALECETPFTLRMMWHKGTLDSFPSNLEFVKMAAERTPIFKEVSL